MNIYIYTEREKTRNKINKEKILIERERKQMKQKRTERGRKQRILRKYNRNRRKIKVRKTGSLSNKE
jgi:hypothetical protein